MVKSIGRYVKKGYKNTKSMVKKYFKKRGVYGMAKDALSGVQYMHKLINSELKSFASGNAAQDVTYNGYVDHLTPMIQGDLHNQRNGMSVLLRYIQIRGNLKIAGNPDSSVVKIYIVRDKRKLDSTANITAADLFEVTGSVRTPYTYIPVNNRGRFQILATKYIALNKNGKNQQMFNFNIKLTKHTKWQFDSNNKLEGHIYLVMVSDQDTTAGNPPTVDYDFKTKYHDN